jgi:hypothetical protein
MSYYLAEFLVSFYQVWPHGLYIYCYVDNSVIDRVPVQGDHKDSDDPDTLKEAKGHTTEGVPTVAC